MSHQHCVVPHCNKSGYRLVSGKKVTYHRFPKEKQLKKQWLIKIKRDECDSFKVKPHTTVCSLHFSDRDFEIHGFSGRRTLHPGAVPSIFECWKKIPHAYKKQNRRAPNKLAKSCSYALNSANKQSSATELQQSNCDDTPEQVNESIVESHIELSEKFKQLQNKYDILEREYETLNSTLSEMNEKHQHLLIQSKDLEDKLNASKFSIDNIDDKDFSFYTGFPCKGVFHSLLKFVNPGNNCQNIRYIYNHNHSDNEKSSRGRKRKLSPENEFFMFLCRLRLGLFEVDLSYRFQISKSTVSTIIIAWANFLYLKLGSLNIWPSKQSIKETMPKSFETKYPETRCIIDATEIKVNMPSSLTLKSQTYSNYKGTNTLKGLIGISPQGSISFVSQLYTGNISDREITERSGILKMPYTPGDVIMADKGFEIQDLLDPLGVTLNIPPFLRLQDQMPADDVIETQQIAAERVHVERAINKVKNFHIFDRPIPLNLIGSINQIWTVCALLTLFQRPIISQNANIYD